MLLEEYQKRAMRYDLTKDRSPQLRALHMRSGSVEELGEMAAFDKRLIRDGTEPNKDAVLKEFGDRLWYLVGEIECAGFTLEQVAKKNLSKLKDRFDRNVIKGSGDER